MRTGMLAGGVALLALVSGCGATDDRQWMKTTDRYTTHEFQRDYRECTVAGKLDEACLRARGWVPVTPRAEKIRVDKGEIRRSY